MSGDGDGAGAGAERPHTFINNHNKPRQANTNKHRVTHMCMGSTLAVLYLHISLLSPILLLVNALACHNCLMYVCYINEHKMAAWGGTNFLLVHKMTVKTTGTDGVSCYVMSWSVMFCDVMYADECHVVPDYCDFLFSVIDV